MPHEAAETRPLLWDQAAVSREAHWRQGCLCQWVWGTVPCCRAVCSAGSVGLGHPACSAHSQTLSSLGLRAAAPRATLQVSHMRPASAVPEPEPLPPTPTP